MTNPKLLELYDIAEANNIMIFCEETSKTKSMSAMADSGNCYIGINPFMLESYADEMAALAHEIGHCETGSFYNIYSPFDIRSRHEYRADKWAIKKLVPKDELIKAFEDGCENSYELSEYFGVPQWFMDKVLKFYKEY